MIASLRVHRDVVQIDQRVEEGVSVLFGVEWLSFLAIQERSASADKSQVCTRERREHGRARTARFWQERLGAPSIRSIIAKRAAAAGAARRRLRAAW